MRTLALRSSDVNPHSACWLKGLKINALPDRLPLFSGADAHHQLGSFNVSLRRWPPCTVWWRMKT